MIASVVADLGAWSWVVIGLVLLVLELLVPGVFLLWIGIAALIVGALSLALWDTAFWVWEVQVPVFLALSLVAAYAGKRMMGDRAGVSDQPFLNRRAEQLVGRRATLAEPIRNGRGRLSLDDTVWRVTGPDLPAGADVLVAGVGSDELELVIEAA